MTTSENDFKNKCKNMRELFFDKQKIKAHFDFDDVLTYTSEPKINYTSHYDEDYFAEYCSFNIRLPEKSTDLSECDKFYELFFNKTQSKDTDGVKYTSNLRRGRYSIDCHFQMKYIKKFESKYF